MKPGMLKLKKKQNITVFIWFINGKEVKIDWKNQLGPRQKTPSLVEYFALPWK